jgi:hypothetical protein
MIKEDNITKRQLQLNFRDEVYKNGDSCYKGGTYQVDYSDKEGRVATLNSRIIVLVEQIFKELDEQERRRKWVDKHKNFDNYSNERKNKNAHSRARQRTF